MTINPPAAGPAAPPQGEGDGEAFVFPASSGQQRFWLLDQVEPGNPAFNVAVRFQLEGALHVPTLERAFNEIIRRHEILRTTFAMNKEEVVQVVAPSLRIRVSVIDLRCLPEDQRRVEAGRLATVEAREPFDLKVAPLIRVSLLQLAAEECMLLVTIHHAVSDGWSIGVITDELAAIYEAFVKGLPSPLPELAVQYADFTLWQRDALEGAVIEKQLDYWREKLRGATELDLATDRPRPSKHSYDGDIVSVLLPRALTDALGELGAAEDATLFMVMLTAFNILLHRYTGQSDIVVGSPIASRNRVEIEPLIGVFINTLTLRNDLSGDPLFTEALARVRDTVLGAMTNQDVPFEKAVESLCPAREARRNPFFQISFIYQRDFIRPVEFGGVRLTAIPSKSPGSIFDLTFFMVERAEGWRASCEFNTDLFEAATVGRMLAHFANLLEAIVKSPRRRISEYAFLTGEERRRALVEWNETRTDFPHDRTIADLFAAQAERTPDAVAVEYGDEKRTYRELDAAANRLAHFLQKQGVGPDVVVAVHLERSIESIVAMLGILKAGGAYLPVDAACPPARIAFMLRDADARLTLTRRVLARALPVDAHVVCVDVERFDGESASRPACAATADNLACVIYTSGSTGQPKGVAVPQRAVNRLVLNTNYVLFGPGDGVAHASNTAFDAATFEVWGALLNGARLSIVGRDTLLSPHALCRELQARKISVLFLTTPLFNSLAREIPEAFSGLRYLVVGGDALDPSAARAVLASRPPQHLVNGYGPTETTTFAICHRVESVPENATGIPIGRPISNTTAYILDPSRNPVPIGVAGEIYIGGPGVARGYVNRPELTAQCFVHDPFSDDPEARLYKTGDLARRLPDGAIEFLGRIDNQVKLRGFRVELSEIEATLNRHPDVRECAVVVGENAGEKSLAAYPVLANQRTPAREAEKALREFLKSELPDYMVPASFVFLEKLPLTPNGKMDRRALPRPDFEPRSDARKFVAPRTRTEADLARIWEHFLDRHGISVDDDFFEMGGHSLMAMRMFVRIREELGRTLPLSTLFHAPTIRELASEIDAQMPEERVVSTLVALHPGGTEPAVFCIHGADGGTLLYRGLNGHLGASRPIFALEAPWLIDDVAQESVEEMAAFYIAQIRSAQPAGPYHLAGYSLGGVVAYEMAQQLRAEGADVGLVVLFDSYNPQKLPRRFTISERVGMNRRLAAGMPFSKKIRLLAGRAIGKAVAIANRENGRVRRFIARLRKRANARLSAELRVAHGRELGERAWFKYEPQPYPGPVLLFVADDPPDGFAYLPDRGWSGLAARLELCRINGAMHESMLAEPHARTVGTMLAERLAGSFR